jgi:hypothetical protein
MLLYITLTKWTVHLIYFWISILDLCLAPFWFNPHQFAFSDIIVDDWYVLFSLQAGIFNIFTREFLRWMCDFFKTYYEKRSIGNLFVNFNRIFVIHIAVYHFYIAYNSPNVFKVQGKNSAAMALVRNDNCHSL